MPLETPSALSQPASQPPKQATSSISGMLMPSEIEQLRRADIEMHASVRKALAENKRARIGEAAE